MALLAPSVLRAAGPTESYSRNVAEWVDVARPAPDSLAGLIWFSAANHSRYGWRVFRDGEAIGAVAETRPTRSPDAKPTFPTRHDPLGNGSLFCQVTDGWIVAYNQGEFGAALRWFSTDGKSERSISAHQVNQFLRQGDRIFAVEGLAHLTMSTGSLIELKESGGRWTVVTLAECPEAPEAFAETGDESFVIAFSGSFGIYEKGKGLRILAKDMWGGPNPTSLVVSADKQIAYVGMRQYVVEIDLGTGRARYLVPSEAFLNKLPAIEVEGLRRQFDEMKRSAP